MKKTLFQQVFEMNAKYLEREFGQKVLELAAQKAFNELAHKLAFDRNAFNEPANMVERKKRYGRI